MNESAHIMIIDDEDIMLKLMQKILSDEGYFITTAKSGEQAISVLNTGITPDLILLDIAMPVMDGYETFRQIKTIINVPIIFLTGNNDTESELIGLRLGAIDYITKPFVKDILVTRIKNHLDNFKNTHIQKQAVDSPAVIFDYNKLKNMEEILTDSELKVAKMIALGYTNQEIADNLSYSYGYVKKVAYRIFDKLDVSKRNEVRPFFVK